MPRKAHLHTCERHTQVNVHVARLRVVYKRSKDHTHPTEGRKQMRPDKKINIVSPNAKALAIRVTDLHHLVHDK